MLNERIRRLRTRVYAHQEASPPERADIEIERYDAQLAAAIAVEDKSMRWYVDAQAAVYAPIRCRLATHAQRTALDAFIKASAAAKLTAEQAHDCSPPNDVAPLQIIADERLDEAREAWRATNLLPCAMTTTEQKRDAKIYNV